MAILRSSLLRLLALGAVIVATIIARSIILGGATHLTLSTAAPLTGVVAQSLYTPTSGSVVNNTDFKLENTRYFDAHQWVVTTVVPTNKTVNQGFEILEKKQGLFQVVAGPGSAFPRDYTVSLPNDLAGYLTTQGVFYDATSN